MSSIVLSALLLSLIVYLLIGFTLGKKMHKVADLFPLISQRQSEVRNSSEFSASTVATTISLATVVVAFFDLAPYFGVWLYWCVVTTAIGILLVRVLGKRIWKRLSVYNKKLSLHEFLGEEFNSKTVKITSAFCTSLGFIGLFATELTVGSRFIAQLVGQSPLGQFPLGQFPEWVFVIIFSIVAFTYTMLGGFRAVIITDKLQMFAIWLLLISLSFFYYHYITDHGGWDYNYGKVREEIKYFTWRDSLPSFLLGIFIINTLAYTVDMSVWQRIAGAGKEKTILQGLWQSVLVSAATWTILISLACLTFVVIFPKESENPLITLLKYIFVEEAYIGKVVLFFVTLGIFGAMLSTASTQLIAVSHTIYEDLTTLFRKVTFQNRLDSSKEVTFSRLILVGAAILGVVLVELLRIIGFSIADLIFAIYGAQLGLLPPILLILFKKEGSSLRRFSKWAGAAIFFGFMAGWGSAIYGKTLGNSDLIFLSPCISLAVSTLLVVIAFFFVRKETVVAK